jgi:hypothetical protein
MGSHKRFILDRAYEAYLLKQAKYYLITSFLIYLFIAIIFNETLVWLIGTIFFLITGVIILMVIAERDISKAQDYVRIYVDKRLGKGQYEKMIRLMHERRESIKVK